ncbi:hypothetical protein [Nocardioides sp. Iso805N]|uniref:hypothetical protein n=1 Tax=Nocardioides sp. Iso805N TaxID=1283287 RepID=UPI00039CAE93|nr:hypothetical protein [Nocardioides sp. Iso805N]
MVVRGAPPRHGLVLEPYRIIHGRRTPKLVWLDRALNAPEASRDVALVTFETA